MSYANIQFEPDKVNPVGQPPHQFIRGRVKIRIYDDTLGELGGDLPGLIIGRDLDGCDIQVKSVGSRTLTDDTKAWLGKLIEENAELREMLPPRQPPKRCTIQLNGPETEF